MELSLNQNIRLYRKEMHLTQEQLAEAMSVSVATISKWERGSISPDVEMLAELADFFHISVDVLLGYDWKTRSMGQCTEHIRTLRNEGKYAEGASEVHKVLQKYPHSFPVVYECGKLLFAAIADKSQKEQHAERDELEFLLKVYNHALELYEQNMDKTIKRESLYQDIGSIYALMGEKKKAVEYLEEHNEYHVNDHMIGALLSQMGEYEKAWEYIPETFRRNLFDLCVSYDGCINLLMNTGKYNDVIGMSEWMQHLCSKIAAEEGSYFQLISARADTITATAYAYKMVREKVDYQTQIECFLKRAMSRARQFDEKPDYMGRIRFVTQSSEQLRDYYGRSAVMAVKNVLGYSKEDGQPYWYLNDCYQKVSKFFESSGVMSRNE